MSSVKRSGNGPAVSNDVAEIGTRIRSLRCARGLTQAELAGPKLSESYVSLIESGKRQPGTRTLQAIAERLEISVDELTAHVVPTDPQVSFALAFVELAVMNGDMDSARSAVAAIHKDSRLDCRSAARVLAAEAKLAESEGDLETATSLLEQVLADEQTDPAAWAEAATSLVRCHRERGNLVEAIEVGERCTAQLVSAGLSGTPQHVAVGLTMASAYHERGDVIRAARVVEGLVVESERVGSREARGYAYWNAALIARGEGRKLDAVKLAEKAVALVSEGDDKRRLARLTAAQGQILLSLDEPQISRGVELLLKAYTQMEECGTTVELASIATELGQAEILAGEPIEAERWARRSLELLGDEPRLETAQSWMVLAHAQTLQGQSEAASHTARLSASMLESMGASRKAAKIWRELGDLMNRQGQHAQACMAYDRALESMGLVAAPKAPEPKRAAAPAVEYCASVLHAGI
jgi:tetratricopeptide (TPR) repeat protein/DNA-binding XRE family transcriptional regulator